MADDKVKVRFLRDEIYETEGRGLGKQFTAGRVYSMTADQAGRWIRRDAAELVEDATAAEEDEPPKPRRGRPPKAKVGESDDGDESDDDDEEPAKAPPQPVKPPEPAPRPSPAEPARPPYRTR